MAELAMYRGDTSVFRFSIFGVDEDGEQAPFDLTTCDIFFTVKESKADLDAAAIIAVDSSDPNFDVDDPTDGRFLLTILPDDTDSLVMTEDEETFFYDIQVVDGTDVYTVDVGTLTIYRDVTIRIA